MSGALRPGTLIDRYRVSGTIGAGSMGDVVRAVDVELNRAVAIKILSDRHRENGELRARFVREGRAVAAISHPNVVQVFTTGTFDGRPYIAMELLDGVDLGSVVKQHGVMTSVQAARAALDGARGLEAAAQAGLIHRDVKPTNLVLLSSGVVKVTDFGLAKPLDPSNEPALTAMGVVVGTPDYIAPEQARGEAIDERVDLYALGGTLYYLLVGSPPFRTGNPSEDKYLKVVARHLKQPAPDPRAVDPAIDVEVAALSLRLMSKKPAERPTYPDLIRQLSSIIDRLQAHGASALPEVSSASQRAEPEPTPLVGGPTGSPRMIGREPGRGPSGGGVRGSPAEAALAQDGGDEESAATMVRDQKTAPAVGSVAARGGDESSARPDDAPARSARWLVAVTVVSALVFFTGLGLLLFGPRPADDTSTAAAVDAAPATDAAPVARVDPTPPAGMLLVKRADGTPWLFVSRAPVSQGQYAPRSAAEKRPPRSRKVDAQPVVRVSYAQAEAYARAQGKRLPTPEEWARAASADGFAPAGKTLWEWVDDGTEGAQALRAVRGHPSRADRLRPVPHVSVTFRLAADL